MIAALIIATGKTESSDTFQPLKKLGGITAIERQIHVFQMADVDRVVIVVGEDHLALERKIARMGAVCLFNENYKTAEMLDNVKLGLRYLTGKCRKVLITPADVPLFSADTVRQLMATGKKLAIPSHNHRGGHPLMLSAKFFPTVLGYQGEGGLSGAVKASGQEDIYLDVADEGVVTDVQRQQDHQHLLESHSLQALHPEFKLYLARERVFFGPGPYLLLSLIEETESLRLACQQMGISYSKGWNMVSNMEKQVGYSLVARQRGGKEKGRSDITPKGQELLRTYTAFQRDTKQQVQRLFEKHFGKQDIPSQPELELDNPTE